MTITKERLLKIQHWREIYGADSNVMLPAEEAAELARIALASLEAEPIGAFHIADQPVGGTSDYIKDGEWPIDNGVIEVYAAPPATVVPEKLPCSVELKPGLIIGKGCKTETLLTALRRRAEYYAKLETMTPEEREKHGASIEAFKAMLPQPAPVVPEDISGIIERFRYQADHLSDWHHIDEHSCKVNRRDLMTALEFMDSCRAAMLQGGENSKSLHAVKAAPVLNYSVKNIELLHADCRGKSDGNSPVIGIDMASEPDRSVEVRYLAPPGYVMVPKVVTPEISNAINEVGQRCTCGNCSQRLWDLLLASAPVQEVK